MTAGRGDQRPPAVDGDEKAMLVAFLGYLREAAIAKVLGVPDTEARQPRVGSGTSLMWLIKHLTVAEQRWFVWYFTGAEPWPEDAVVEPADTVEELVDAYRAMTAATDAIVAAADLPAVGPRQFKEGERPPSLRWVLLHMIEETARHAGHADILREQIDGSIGR